MSWALLVLVALLVVGVHCQTWNIQQNLGTQSPYWSENSTTSTPPPPGCTAMHVNLLSRHGSRYPTDGDIESLTELEGLVKKFGSYITIPYVKSWTNPYPLNQAGFLSTSGQQELYSMGQRYNDTYFPLFSQPYYPDVFVMQSTQVPRAGVSASSFAQGFLQGEGGIGPSDYQPPYVFSNTPELDYLRFFDNCPVYTEASDNGTINTSEADSYADQYYPAIAARVGQVLGVAPYWNITIDELDAMFTACAFEVTVFQRTDGWCQVFSPNDINTYTYVGDLEDYYEKSYGSGIGYQISAVILQSMVTTMEGIMNRADPYQYQNAYLRFAHAEDIIPFAALLGLFKDEFPLTANLSTGQIETRKWTTSVISPMGANIALILYNCGNGEYKVKLTHNEVEYFFPGCDDLFCSYTQFTSLYADALSFNFTSSCALTDPPSLPAKQSIPVAVFAIGVVVAFVVGVALMAVFAVAYVRRLKVPKYGALQTA